MSVLTYPKPREAVPRPNAPKRVTILGATGSIGESTLDLIGRIMQYAPASSVLVVEADERFDLAQLPSLVASRNIVENDDHSEIADDANWRVRAYPPAVIGIWTKR